MITFTKEQLIASAHARIEFAEMMLAGELEPLKERTWSIELELARIALASLEAEPVGEVSEQRDGLVMDGMVDLGGASTHRIIKGASKMKRLPLGTKFYTAPPAPVALTSGYSDFEEIWSSSTHPLTQDDEMKDFAWDIWNACRAAMLQSFGNSEQLNSPVIQDGWVACSERMPDKGQNVLISVNFDSPLIEPLICSARYTGSTFRRGDVTVKPGEGVEEVTHWMPLPAAPQQEVK
ncbi:DUF551 domain-containing protein [Enterobacter roggenkampii]|uniref:DUF551 domain-containing protein n=1 Tax=Enterobacter roggenkampii TaxID=1812935 RepID=UPI00200427AF|nr:DUF551 domain-containing protein [Enterobacter roggenkampii]MCK6885120.1 DUF551 domain-containing protein [Enterobacter roggenkampii]